MALRNLSVSCNPRGKRKGSALAPCDAGQGVVGGSGGRTEEPGHAAMIDWRGGESRPRRLSSAFISADSNLGGIFKGTI